MAPRESGYWAVTVSGSTAQPPLTRAHAILMCVFAALTAVVSAGLLVAVALVPAPTIVVPFAIPICLGCPMVAVYELPRAVAVLRDPSAALRRDLDRLPETPHPLGL